MIIYNITMKVDNAIADAWLQWLLNEYIPAVMQTKCFAAYKVVRLIEVDDSEGPTYAVQFTAESKSDYNRFIEMHSTNMSEHSFRKWGDRFIAFRSAMEVIQ